MSTPETALGRPHQPWSQVALSPLDVESAAVEMLPARTALGSMFNITTIVPINIAIAVNAATMHSSAGAFAMQGVSAHL